MNTHIYSQAVQAKEGLDAVLKKCCLTHLSIYNHSLELLKNTPSMEYSDLREQVFRYVEDNKVQTLHIQIVQNEIYYQYKKFKRERSHGQKLLSSIQYFTLILKDFNNGVVQIDDSRTKLSLSDQPGYFELPVPLPDFDLSQGPFYLNLSYSAMENQIKMSIFRQRQ